MKRLPNAVMYTTLGACLLPVLLTLAGVEFRIGGPIGSLFHVVMEWSALSIALLSCIFGFANYTVRKDPAIPIIGLTFLCVAIIDVFHLAVTSKIIESAANYEDLVSFTWTISRLFAAVVCLVGVGIFLVSASINRRKGLRFISFMGVLFVSSALAACYVCYASPVMPKTQFPGELLSQPWDTLPLVIFGFRAYVFYVFYKRYPSPFSFALILTSVPDILGQFYMSFGSASINSHSYVYAHYLKVVSYSLPFVGLCFDYITTHRKMSSIQRELRSSVERYDLAVEGSHEALWDWDLENKEIYFSPRFNEFLGFEPVELKGEFSIFEERLHFEDHDVLVKKLNDHFDHKTPFDVECRIRKKDESYCWFRMRGQALWDIDNKPIRIAGSLSDIDQMKRARMSIEEERRRAEEASKAKSEFVANMSHEIRTPMNAIVGMTDLLAQTEMREDQSRYVDALGRSSESLLKLINDILDFSKIEAGQLSLKNEPFNVTGVMDRVSEIFSVSSKEKDIDLVFHVDPNMPTGFVGDAFRLRQVLLNLVGNAIKFTLEGGVISVNVSANFLAGRDYELTFSVKDTGIGISDSYKEKIFDSFTQATSGVAEQYGGTGLGLAICSRIVGLMGGEISVESRLGEGSTFSFTVHMKIHEEELPQFDINTLNMKGLRVFVVDDIPVNRVILKETLSGCGANVEEFSSGDEAYAKLKEEAEKGLKVDIAILDGRMPGLDGFALAECISEEKLPVDSLILLTSDDSPNVIQRLKDVGVENYLVKPLRRNDLLEVIQRNVKSPQTLKERSEMETKALEVPLNILLVDDNPDNRMLVQSYLKGLPYKIDSADDGTTALDRFFHNSYDIVLMDVRMKIMNGHQATQKIREWEKNNGKEKTPVIALTAYAMKKDIEAALEAGCDGHLAKPVRRKELLGAILEYANVSQISDNKEASVSQSETGQVIELDKELIGQLSDLIPSFLTNRQADIDKLKDAFSVNDFEVIETIGHNMAGTAPGYGFSGLGEIGVALEDAAIAKDRDVIEAEIKKLEEALAWVQEELAA